MQNHIASLLAFLLLTLISISYGASITGTITNPAGDSIPDVEVSLKDNYGPTTEYSDADGFYEFASTVTKGRYILEIFHGVDTIVDTINIEDDNDFITKDYVLEHAVALTGMYDGSTVFPNSLQVLKMGSSYIIKNAEIDEYYRVWVTDILGKEVYSFSGNKCFEKKLMTENWKQGVYLIHFKIKSKHVISRFLFLINE